MQAVPRQKNAQQYGEQLKQRFGHMKQVKRILRFATATNIATPTVSRIHQIVLGGEYFPGLNVDPGQETRSLVHMDRWRQLLHTVYDYCSNSMPAALCCQFAVGLCIT